MSILNTKITTALLGEPNYYLLRAYRNLWQANLRQKEHLFVHQMGKVGSSSVISSLQANDVVKQMALHWTHFVSDEGLALLVQLYTDGYGGWDSFPTNIKGHVQKSRALNRELKRWQNQGRRCKVITMVRDPLKTNISGFFQNYQWWPQELITACKNRTPGYLDTLAERFFATYPHDVPVTWFDMEIKAVFGIDVFAATQPQPFPQAKGYAIYRGDFADLLVMKLESLSDCASQALGEFLNLEKFTLMRSNEAREKWYAPIYREFMAQVSIPDDYLNRLYHSRYAQFFYGETV